MRPNFGCGATKLPPPQRAEHQAGLHRYGFVLLGIHRPAFHQKKVP